MLCYSKVYHEYGVNDCQCPLRYSDRTMIMANFLYLVPAKVSMVIAEECPVFRHILVSNFWNYWYTTWSGKNFKQFIDSIWYEVEKYYKKK